MRQIQFRLGLCSKRRRERLQLSLKLPSWISGGLLLKDGDGREKEKERRGKRQQKNGRKEERKGKKVK